MSQFPTYSLAGGNQYPAVATSVPAQYPVISIVDAQGSLVTNIGNGPADGTWTNITLTAAATAVAGFPPQYMKDSRGIVHCQGKVNVVSTGTGFTLPTGYRPMGPTYYDFVTSNNSATIAANGNVNWNTASVTADLSVIHFATVLI